MFSVELKNSEFLYIAFVSEFYLKKFMVMTSIFWIMEDAISCAAMTYLYLERKEPRLKG